MLADLSTCRVISVEYRLAPEHKFPAAVEDALAAVRWIETNAMQLGVDPNRLGVGGDSAGATLAAVVCQIARDAGSPNLAYQVLLFPCTHVDADTNSRRSLTNDVFLDARTLAWFFGHYFGSEGNPADPKASPLLADNFGGLPPAYIVVGGHDPLHDEGVAYAEKLRAAGVSVTLDDYADLTHDFIYLQAVLPQAGTALRKLAEALKAALAR
jgi:acetyl esterase